MQRYQQNTLQSVQVFINKTRALIDLLPPGHEGVLMGQEALGVLEILLTEDTGKHLSYDQIAQLVRYVSGMLYQFLIREQLKRAPFPLSSYQMKWLVVLGESCGMKIGEYQAMQRATATQSLVVGGPRYPIMNAYDLSWTAYTKLPPTVAYYLAGRYVNHIDDMEYMANELLRLVLPNAERLYAPALRLTLRLAHSLGIYINRARFSWIQQEEWIQIMGTWWSYEECEQAYQSVMRALIGALKHVPQQLPRAGRTDYRTVEWKMEKLLMSTGGEIIVKHNSPKYMLRALATYRERARIRNKQGYKGPQ